jgi:pyruvate dehydrogenase E1 component
MDQIQAAWEIDPDDPWSMLDPQSDAGKLCLEAAARLAKAEPVANSGLRVEFPEALDTRNPQMTSTQEALGRTLTRLADFEEARSRIVTLSPDVATSTHLSGWINKVGVFSQEQSLDFEEAGQRMLKWQPNPDGQHIELGISEMNLFMALSQFGLSDELTGQHLIPIGTVYDPFVCRGLDALIYGLYVGAKMIFAGTPSGVSLSPEGGAHQSTVTPSLGIELPGVRFYEPAFASEVEWILLDALNRCRDRENGSSTYLRLSTKAIDQALAKSVTERIEQPALRQAVLAGGYRLIEWQQAAPDLDPRDCVQIATAGIMVPEAVDAARRLHEEGVAANVLVITSAERLYAEIRNARRSQLRSAGTPLDLGHLESLIPAAERRAPIVTVQDGASHSMAFLGSAWGVPVVSLGVDDFGQSGSRADLYHATGIDADQIVNAAMLSLDLVTA